MALMIGLPGSFVQLKEFQENVASGQSRKVVGVHFGFLTPLRLASRCMEQERLDG